jgi:malate dehydrogenase
MREVAIIGAGELGGMIAHVVARRHAARSIRLIDETGRVAEGKALDIAQAAPIEGFSTTIAGSTDVSRAAGASVLVVADRAGATEWQGEDGLMLLRRLLQTAPNAVILCAGASQRELVERGIRELGIPRGRLVGSAPEALTAAARAIAALELDRSPADVALSIVGVPPAQIVVLWEDATVGGFSITKLLSEPVRRKLTGRIAALWPPGPYALAFAAAQAVDALFGRSRRVVSCFVGPDDSAGRRTRTTALPARLGPAGITEIVIPALTVVERVALENAMLL